MVFETTADNVLHETGMCTSLPLAKNVPMQTQTLQNPTYPGWWLSRICIVAVLVRKIQNQSVGCKSSETHRRLLFLFCLGHSRMISLNSILCLRPLTLSLQLLQAIKPSTWRRSRRVDSHHLLVFQSLTSHMPTIFFFVKKS